MLQHNSQLGYGFYFEVSQGLYFWARLKKQDHASNAEKSTKFFSLNNSYDKWLLEQRLIQNYSDFDNHAFTSKNIRQILEASFQKILIFVRLAFPSLLSGNQSTLSRTFIDTEFCMKKIMLMMD